MKRQSIKQRRSLAAKKGWRTRIDREDREIIAAGELKEKLKAEALNALSNGPPNIERDTDWGAVGRGTPQRLANVYTEDEAGITALKGRLARESEPVKPKQISHLGRFSNWLRKALGGRA